MISICKGFSLFSLQRNLTNPALIFGGFGRKTKIFEFLTKFLNDFCGNLRKCIILAYFSKELTNLCVHFSPFGQKTQIVGKS